QSMPLVLMVASNMLRPWVTATSLDVPRQTRSSTSTLAGAALVGGQFAPKSGDAETPRSVPTYNQPRKAGCSTMALTGARGSVWAVPGLPGPTILIQELPPLSVRHTLSAL